MASFLRWLGAHSLCPQPPAVLTACERPPAKHHAVDDYQPCLSPKPMFPHQKTLEWKLQKVPVQAHLTYPAPSTVAQSTHPISIHWMNEWMNECLFPVVYHQVCSPNISRLKLRISPSFPPDTILQETRIWNLQSAYVSLLWALYWVLPTSPLIYLSISFVPGPTVKATVHTSSFFFFWDIIFFPVSLRNNWHRAVYKFKVCKFKVYSIIIWFTYIMKWLSQ